MITFLAVCVSALLVVSAFRVRWVFVKPSMQFVVAANLLLQWPMVIWHDRIFEGVQEPSYVALGVAIPLLVSLAWIPYVGGRSCQKLLLVLQRNADNVSYRENVLALATLWCLVLAATGWYLVEVPLRQTGLYAIVMHPVAAALAREDSLKLLTNRLLVYVQLTVALAVCPIIAALSLRLALHRWRNRRWLQCVGYFVSIVAALMVSSLSGARSPAARVVLAVALSLWFEHGMPLRVIRTAIVGAAVVVPVAFLSILREGRTVDATTLAQHLVTGVADRALVVPAEVGVWHIRYAEAHGLFGAAAVPKLATLFGVSSMNPANVVGRHYSLDPLPSMSANASFLLTYISYFGPAAILLNCMLLGLFECGLLVLRYTGPTLLAPTLATLCVANISFLSGDFTTVLTSHRIVVLAVLVIGLTWVLGERGVAAA